MKVTNNFIIQQQVADDEMYRLVNKLLATGKCRPHISPDCFVWTGTLAELQDLIEKPLVIEPPKQ